MESGTISSSGQQVHFNDHTRIILFVSRCAARVENYLNFLIDHFTDKKPSVNTPLRDVVIPETVLAILKEKREVLHDILLAQ
eukprot:5886543-Alexandrium_andersonii.AAC.1